MSNATPTVMILSQQTLLKIFSNLKKKRFKFSLIRDPPPTRDRYSSYSFDSFF